MFLTPVWHAYFPFFYLHLIDETVRGGEQEGGEVVVCVCATLVFSVPAASNTADWFFRVSSRSVDRV